jgi:hypothetical protein
VLVLVAAITFTIDSTKGFTIKKQISNAVLQTQQAYETLTIKKQISNTDLQTQQASETNIGALGSGRMYYYKHFIKVPFINLKHGLFGIGPDCLYRYGYVPFGNVNGQENFQFDHKAHSDLIEYAATMGIPALVFYICFIVSIFYPVFKQIHSVPPEFLAIFAASLGYLIQSFFNIPNVVLAGIFFAFTAIIELHNNVAKDALAE